MGHSRGAATLRDCDRVVLVLSTNVSSAFLVSIHVADMSFNDIETGLAQRPLSPNGVPQSPEESAFVTLQSSLSLQVFKINSNVQGILKLVDQLGTARDSAQLRKSL